MMRTGIQIGILFLGLCVFIDSVSAAESTYRLESGRILENVTVLERVEDGVRLRHREGIGLYRYTEFIEADRERLRAAEVVPPDHSMLNIVSSPHTVSPVGDHGFLHPPAHPHTDLFPVRLSNLRGIRTEIRQSQTQPSPVSTARSRPRTLTTRGRSKYVPPRTVGMVSPPREPSPRYDYAVRFTVRNLTTSEQNIRVQIIVPPVQVPRSSQTIDLAPGDARDIEMSPGIFSPTRRLDSATLRLSIGREHRDFTVNFR